MNSNLENRSYAAPTLKRFGVVLPARYQIMLAGTPAHRAINRISPWFFPTDPERAIGFCSEAAGYPVLPFAQAVEEDMMACFVPQLSGEPAVIVINPWSEDATSIVLAQLPNYDAWLTYATEVARKVQTREADEDKE